MTQALNLVETWASDLALATPHASPSDVAGLNRLPSEWTAVDGIVLEDTVIDHVVVGPNGVFTVSIDPDPTPATIGPDGLYRDGSRVTATVKSALLTAHDLRRRVGRPLFAYPMLVTTIEGDPGDLDRLGVVPGNRIAEAIWSHPGVPLTRTVRIEIEWALRSLTGR